MAIRPLLVWRNADSTKDLNEQSGLRTRRAVFPLRGVPVGGTLGTGLVTPSTTSLDITVDPFIAHGWDGMVTISDTTLSVTLPVPAVGTDTYWVVLYSRYQLFQAPTVNFQIVPDSTIQTAVDQEFYVRFARVEVTAGAVAADGPNTTWYYGEGDHSASLSSRFWKDPVANAAALPLRTSVPPYLGNPPNQDGDVRIALDTGVAWRWNETAGTWDTLSGVTTVGQTVARQNQLTRKLQRSYGGTGIESAGNSETGQYADTLDTSQALASSLQVVNVDANSTGVQSVRIAPFNGYVNGHPVATAATTVVLSIPPAAERYDLIYFEVWREVLATAISSFVYETETGALVGFAAIEQLMEQIANEDPFFDPTSFNFRNLEVNDAGDVLVTTWAYGIHTVTEPADVQLSTLGAVSSAPGSVGVYAAVANNERLSTITCTAYQSIAYAIPLVVVKRYPTDASFIPSISARLAAPAANGNGLNVWAVAPVTDTVVAKKANRKLIDELGNSLLQHTKEPAGWQDGYKTELTVSGTTLVIPAGKVAAKRAAKSPDAIIVDVPEVNLNTILTPPQGPTALPAGPNARRDLVHLVYWFSTVYAELASEDVLSGVDTVGRVEPAFGPIPTQLQSKNTVGTEVVYLYGAYVLSTAGIAYNVTQAYTNATLNVYGSSLPFVAANTLSVDEPGMWLVDTAAIPAWANEWGSLAATIHSLPVAMIHRRNDEAFGRVLGNDNFNGSTVGLALRPEEEYLHYLPDGTAGTVTAGVNNILPRELIDRRHASDSDLDFEQVLAESMDQIARGQLRTAMQGYPSPGVAGAVNDVAGTSHLMLNTIGTSPTAPPGSGVPIAGPLALDGVRGSFSDAVETQVVSWTFNPGAVPLVGAAVIYDSQTHVDLVSNSPFGDGGGSAIYTVTYAPVGNATELRVRAPKGSYIHTGNQAPSAFIVGTTKSTGAGTLLNNIDTYGLQSFAHIHCDNTAISTPLGTSPSPVILRPTAVNTGSGGGAVVDSRISYNFTHDQFANVAVTINAVDANGRPTDISYLWDVFDDPADPLSSSGLAVGQVVCAFVYDKPRSANTALADFSRYSESGPTAPEDDVTGLTLVPEQIYNVSGVIRLTAYDDISVGPLYKLVEIVLLGAASEITVSAAHAAWTGETGVQIYGVLGSADVDAGVANVPVIQGVRSNAAGVPFPIGAASGMIVTFSSTVPAGATVRLKVAYTSDQNKYWVNINKASKAVIGPFTWACDRQEVSVAAASNSRSGVFERYYTLGVSHPCQAPNDFAIGVPGARNSGLFIGGEAHTPFGLYVTDVGGATTTGVALALPGTPALWANGTYPSVPWAAPGDGGGRWDFGTVSSAASGGARFGRTTMYYDTSGCAAEPVVTLGEISHVFALQLPLLAGDSMQILYEGIIYQGAMGNPRDTGLAINNLLALAEALIPPNTYSGTGAVPSDASLTYEAVSDLFVTTAGAGVPYIDHKLFGAVGFYQTGAQNDEDFRGAFYDPELAQRHGMSVTYRKRMLDQERLRRPSTLAGNTVYGRPNIFKDLSYQPAADDLYDTVMHHVPGPPATNMSFTTTPQRSMFAGGVGPGHMHDYDHSSITTHQVADETFTGGVAFLNAQNYAVGPNTLIQVPTAKATSGVKAIIPVIFNAVGEEDNQDLTHPYQTSQLFNSPYNANAASGLTVDAKPGFQLVRRVGNLDLALKMAILRAFTAYLPQLVGRNGQSFGMQGHPTLRNVSYTAQLTNDAFAAIPTENLLPCSVDASIRADDLSLAPLQGPRVQDFSQRELSPVMLSQSSSRIAHQYEGNVYWASGGVFFGQPISLTYPATPGVTVFLQKMWAFKGSLVNNAGRVSLQLNSGYGSALLRDWHLTGISGGVYPHTGFSIDAFDPLYRPLRRKD